jgi:hypothetical protein
MLWCTSTDARSELRFVRALLSRGLDAGCVGPFAELVLSSERAVLLVRAFDSEMASDVLWGGYLGVADDGRHYRLCAGHWLDLATLLWARGVHGSRADWRHYAEQLLYALCKSAQWDAKEIVNMLSWSQTRLT